MEIEFAVQLAKFCRKFAGPLDRYQRTQLKLEVLIQLHTKEIIECVDIAKVP